MRSQLSQIKDWEQLAECSNYSLNDLARRCGTSVRQLERFFKESRGISPHKWLSEIRQQRALKLISTGLSAKETAAKLGFKQASHFTREFKKFHNVLPTEIIAIATQCRV